MHQSAEGNHVFYLFKKIGNSKQKPTLIVNCCCEAKGNFQREIVNDFSILGIYAPFFLCLTFIF